MPDDPHCTRCGCNAWTIVGRGQWWGVETITCVCDHCGTRFPLPAAVVDPPDPPEPNELDGGVVYHVVHCPSCGGRDCPVTRTERPIRRHKCRDCGWTFKSVEAA